MKSQFYEGLPLSFQTNAPLKNGQWPFNAEGIRGKFKDIDGHKKFSATLLHTVGDKHEVFPVFIREPFKLLNSLPTEKQAVAATEMYIHGTMEKSTQFPFILNTTGEINVYARVDIVKKTLETYQSSGTSMQLKKAEKYHIYFKGRLLCTLEHGTSKTIIFDHPKFTAPINMPARVLDNIFFEPVVYGKQLLLPVLSAKEQKYLNSITGRLFPEIDLG